MRSVSFLCGLLVLAACSRTGTLSSADPESTRAKQSAAVRRVVGTDPGHVGAGTTLSPRAGDELAAFAAGCFWGVELDDSGERRTTTNNTTKRPARTPARCRVG